MLKPPKGHHVCKFCLELLDFTWDYKDAESLHSCYICHKLKRCRLSDLRKAICTCHCACRACREVQKRHKIGNDSGHGHN